MSLASSKVRDLYPEVRILLETRPATYGIEAGEYVLREPSEVIEINDVTGCSTHVGINGRNSATITLASHRDVLHNRARQVKARSERRQQEISEYLTEVLHLSSLYEINPRRRPLSPGVRRIFGIPVEKLGRFARRLQYVIQQENGRVSSGREPKSRLDEYTAYEWYIADWERMRRVWIDFRDRDRQWVAGFTGIVSSVGDYFQAGDTPLVTINCSGMMRFFELTEFITAAALRFLEWPFQGGAAEFPIQAESNSLSGFSPIDLMALIGSHVNQTFSLTGLPVTKGRLPENYYYHDAILDTSDPTSFGEKNAAIDPVRNFVRGETKTPDLIPKVIIDPQIVRSDRQRLDVYRQAFRQAFELYQFEATSASRIGKDAATTTNYEFFEDPKGNICLWAPKYDALPRILGEAGISKKDLRREAALAAQRGFVSPLIGFTAQGLTTRFGEDYSVLPFHATRYIIDDVSLLSWNLTEAEDGLATFLKVSAQPHYNIQDQDTVAESSTGFTSYERLKANVSEDIAEEVQRLARRFGIRRQTYPTINSNAAFGDQQLLTRYAYAALVRINAYAYSGTLNLEQRPDLWPGRSAFLVERQKLGYITKVSNEFRPRQTHKTTVTLAYIHHPMQRIGNPWWEATANVTPQPQIEAIL